MVLLSCLVRAVNIDRRLIDLYNFLDCVHSITVYLKRGLFLVVKDEPKHHRQKQISHASKENEGRFHSINLSYVLVDDHDKLRDSVSERDADVAASDKHINLAFSISGVPARLYSQAQSVNVSNHQCED